MTGNILLGLRFIIALIFIVSGFEKVTAPAQNFLYVLQAYDFLPDVLERLTALVFPWIELSAGVFLAFGLWTRLVLAGLLVMSGALVGVVLQAILRGLPIDSCGCFGEFVHLPLQGVIILDITIFAAVLWCSRRLEAVRRFSLDGLFDREPS